MFCLNRDSGVGDIPKKIKNNKRFMSRTIALFLCAIIVVGSACVVFAGPNIPIGSSTTGMSQSDEKENPTVTNKVTVGYPLLNAFNEIDPNGLYRGYNYEFLQEMAKYQDLEYKFVMDTWDNCVKKLEEGSIDVMGFMIKTPEREKSLYFSKLDAGKVTLQIATDINNKEFGYKNYEALQGKTIGIMKGAGLESQLDIFLEERGIKLEKAYFNTERQLRAALEDGEIDLTMSTNFWDSQGTQTVADVCSVPFYFAVSKNSPRGEEIFKKIERAMNEILTLDDNYEEKLFDVYGQKTSRKNIYFTKAEKQYIAENPVVRLVYDGTWKPLLYNNEKENSVSGAIAAITQLMAEASGLTFEYVEAKNYDEALEMIKNGEADVISNFVRDLSWADKFNIRLTSPYLSMPLEKVINEKADSKWIALPKNYMSYNKTASFVEENNTIQYYDTIQECYDAVVKGNAKYTYSTSYINNHMMESRKYTQLSVVPLRTAAVELCVGVSKEAPRELLSILEKVTISLSEEEINNIVMDSVIEAEDKSLIHWLSNNPKVVSGIVIAVFVIVMAITLFYVNMKWKNQKLLNYNKVTGIWNYPKFEMEAGSVLKNSPHQQFVIVHINVSKFRFFNDTYGYDAGNEVLAMLAETIERNTTTEEHFASLWADHFVCLLICPDEETLRGRIDDIQEELQRETLNLYDYRIILKCGAYFISKEDIEQGKDINSMLQYANHTLALSHESYRTSVAVYDKNMSYEVENLREVEKDMMNAFYNKEFIPFFQPKYNINTEEMIGVEALVRWKHPTKGIIPPGKFLPYFERTGFITEVDLYIFEESCKYLRKWIDMGKKPIAISSNFSQLHLQDENFVNKVNKIAKKYQVPFEFLEFELTETLDVKEMSIAMKRVADLKELGFLVSIDDFGSGYSSLAVLQELNVDTIKLDRTFMKDGAPSDREYKVMAAIVRLAEDLHMKVICEGVETAEQVEILRQVRCEYAQGYYYAKPMPPEELEELLLDDITGGV